MPLSLDQTEVKNSPQSDCRFVLSGLLQRREGWSLSTRGWCVALALVVCSMLLAVWGIHPFLSVTNRTDSDVLVIEGWMPNYALEEGIAEFKSRPYREVVTVGCEILTGANIEPGDNQASYAARRLEWLGLERKFVRVAASSVRYRDRTFASAWALRRWFETNKQPVRGFNLVTLGPHARRSRLLFEKAFGGKVPVGVISVENREYDPARWWRYSEGVKEVVSETVAYVYVRIFFREPNRPQAMRAP